MFCVITLCTISIHAMKRPRRIELQEPPSKKAATQKKIDNSNVFSFIIKSEILPLSTIIEAHHKHFEAIDTFNHLSLTNKTLNTILNDQTNMLACIKQIAAKFDCSHQRTAKKLRIKSANEIHDWQELLYAGVNEALANPHFATKPLDCLLKMKADINFTYYGIQETLLAVVLQNYHRNESRRIVIDWLLTNHAKIGPITKHKRCAATLALYARDMASAKRLFDHPQFDPHHIDSNGNTLLHHCITVLWQSRHRGMTAQRETDSILQFIEKLLKLGVLIFIKNTKGCTAFMIAKAMKDASTINLLDKYRLSQLQGNQRQQA
jgi:hypothetical protein